MSLAFQVVSKQCVLRSWSLSTRFQLGCKRVTRQIEEMYSVPESFLEIEVRNPQTHGA